MIRIAVKVAAGETVEAGDYLTHTPDGATPQRGPLAGDGAFARVVDPTPGERAPDGSYRVKCELFIARPFAADHSSK